MRVLNRVGPFVVLAAGPLLVSGLPFAHFAESLLATIVAAGIAVLLAAVVMRPGIARRGTVVALADFRRPWVVSFGALLFMMLLRFDTPSTAVRIAMIVAAIAIAALLAVDARALVQLRRFVRVDSGRMRPRTEESPPLGPATVVYDFGFGDGEREELAPAVAMYREREQVLRVVRGSAATARQALLHCVGFDLAVGLPPLVALGAIVAALRIYPY
jgi:hypothetical protein